MEVNTLLVQGTIAIGGLVKCALGGELLICVRLITSSRTRTEVTLTRIEKQRTLKIMPFTCLEKDIKGDRKSSCHAAYTSPLCSCPFLRLKWEPFLTGYGSITFQNLFNVYPEFEGSRSLRNDSLKCWILSSTSKVECFRIFSDWHWIECSHLSLYIMEGSGLWGPSVTKIGFFFLFFK